MKQDIVCRRKLFRRSVITLALASAVAVLAAPTAFSYPAAPIAQYLIASSTHETALARSAAPPAISAHATVMVLTPHGYTTVAKGNNGFVCLVMRSWDHRLASPTFWDTKARTPQCLNAAAHSMLTRYLMRTHWVLAGDSRRQISKHQQAARAAGEFLEPQPGAMCYMMSKYTVIDTKTGAWYPHLMLYYPRAHAPGSSWGANMKGSPVFAGIGENRDIRMFFVLVPNWSDGTPSPADK